MICRSTFTPTWMLHLPYIDIIMKKTILIFILLAIGGVTFSQTPQGLTLIKNNACTEVKNQAASGTCWCFSTLSLVEAETMRKGLGQFDLSEMFLVRNVYLEKAKNYLLRQGAAQFGPGGLGHDLIRAVDTYGAMPEAVYSGLLPGQNNHNHLKMDTELKTYLDELLKKRPLPADWPAGFHAIMNRYMGEAPKTFTYKDKSYTPQLFAREVLQFNPADYVSLTSFTHHPFYQSFVLEAPDNFSNGTLYNLPLDELIVTTEGAIKSGYTLMWDTDMSNDDFSQEKGFAMLADEKNDPENSEKNYSSKKRQELYENLTTQDDHLMHLCGLEQNKSGKRFFIVKNSWGTTGPFKGYIHVSENYFAINTVSLVVPKAALSKELLGKLHLN